MPITNEPLGPVHTSVKTVRKVKELGDQIPKYLIEDSHVTEATQTQYNDLQEVGDDFDPDTLVYKHAKAVFGGSNPPEAILVVRAVPQDTYVSPTSLTVNQASISGVAGQTGKVTTTILPSTATEKNVTATSGDTDVATVSPNGDGSFTIVYKSAGHATITFRAGVNDDITTTTKVTVIANTVPVTGVSLDKTSLSGTAGGNDKLTAKVTPDNATDTKVSFASKDSSIATVDDTGKVAYVKAGETQITATTEDGGFTANCDVTVAASK